MWLSGRGEIQSKVGLDDLEGLFQLQLFYVRNTFTVWTWWVIGLLFLQISS